MCVKDKHLFLKKNLFFENKHLQILCAVCGKCFIIACDEINTLNHRTHFIICVCCQLKEVDKSYTQKL